MALTLVGFVAVLVCGFGIATLVTDSDVIVAPGTGWVPGVIGVLAAASTYAVVVGVGVWPRHPSYWLSASAAFACVIAYLVGVCIAIAVEASDLVFALSAMGQVALSWFAVVVAGAAAIAAWTAVALVRTRARRPRWPWEAGDEDD